jgi:hypothetical protein
VLTWRRSAETGCREHTPVADAGLAAALLARTSVHCQADTDVSIGRRGFSCSSPGEYAAAGRRGCARVPSRRSSLIPLPEHILPGVANHSRDGVSAPAVTRRHPRGEPRGPAHQGREGNLDQPVSRATARSTRAQSFHGPTILYDPDSSPTPHHVTWRCAPSTTWPARVPPDAPRRPPG